MSQKNFLDKLREKGDTTQSRNRDTKYWDLPVELVKDMANARWSYIEAQGERENVCPDMHVFINIY